jgi:hypothetical protein
VLLLVREIWCDNWQRWLVIIWCDNWQRWLVIIWCDNWQRWLVIVWCDNWHRWLVIIWCDNWQRWLVIIWCDNWQRGLVIIWCDNWQRWLVNIWCDNWQRWLVIVSVANRNCNFLTEYFQIILIFLFLFTTRNIFNAYITILVFSLSDWVHDYDNNSMYEAFLNKIYKEMI